MLRQSLPSVTPKRRLGAAAVELALVLPLFVTLTFVSIELGHALNMVQKLESAARNGGRLAAKDVPPALLAGGLTANQKVINDIKNMLRADGFPPNNIAITIVHADGASVGQTFDLADADNQYQMMKITLTIPYADVKMFPLPMLIQQSTMLTSKLIVSRGRSTLNY